MKSLLVSFAWLIAFLHPLSAVEVSGSEVSSSTSPLVDQPALLHQDKNKLLLSSSQGPPGQQRELQTTWSPVGNAIEGEAQNDSSGTVAFSKGGSRLAIGAGSNDGNGINSGHVRVYDYNYSEDNWVQVGNDIDGEAANDWSGRCVAMSEDGSRVAISAGGNDDAGNNSGHVRVYDYDSTQNRWLQVGNDIDGEAAGDQSGAEQGNIAMSKDGSRVAIGSHSNRGDNDVYGLGHVRVFDFDEGSQKWVPVGNPIEGDDTQDWFGKSVAITEDGSRVAIGAPTSLKNGYVRVLDFDLNTQNWVRVGSDLIGENQYDYLGKSVAMNDVGSIVACGGDGNDANGASSGHVRVYQEVSSSGNWAKLGDDIDGAAARDHFGGSGNLAMSKDGSRIAIGSYGHDGGSWGHARMFEYNSGGWVQLGDEIDGEAALDGAANVAMSKDGTRVAIGAGGHDGTNGTNTGHVRVFSSIPLTFPPTGSPTGSPTFTPTNQRSFEIHSTGNVTGTAISGTAIALLATYNASNRVHNTTVLSPDCINSFPVDVAEAFTVTTTEPMSLGDGFIAYNSTIAIDVSKVNTTEYWKDLPGGALGGVLDLCIESAIYFVLPPPDNTQEKMNFVNTNLTLTVEMDTNFEVTTINAERKDATQEKLNLDYSDYVTAYECVESDLVNKANDQEYSQGDELKICVKSKDPTIVQVGGIQRLTLSQDDDTIADDFTYINGGNPVSSEIAATTCDKTITPAHVCHADMQLLGRYFEDESPGELTATGSVKLSFPDGSARRLTVDVPIASGIRGGDLALENSARHMEEEKPDDSPFDVTVSLKSSLDGSGGTNDFNGATLLSGMVGAVGGAILMI